MSSNTLYMHTVPNGKRYVGITRRNPQRRWNHGSGYASNYEFHTDIIKYGWDKIKHEVLLTGLTLEQAQAWEVKMIAKFRTTDPKHGYNFTKGGDHHGEVSERTRTKLRESVNPTNLTPCVCVETRKNYKSLAEAARDIGSTQPKIHKSCQSDGKYSTRGKHFVYADPQRREIVKRNMVLKEAEHWEWEW